MTQIGFSQDQGNGAEQQLPRNDNACQIGPELGPGPDLRQPAKSVDPDQAKREPKTTSHVEALKSTSIIGGSTVIVIFIRMLRTKVLAVLLGPAGVGLEAMYDSVISLAKIGVDMGISGSGVRQIAAAHGSGNPTTIATTVFTLRRVCLMLGLIGAAVLFLTREKVSRVTFGNDDHAFDIGLLSVILLFVALTGGQGALLQGMRRIGDLARMNILGTAFGAVLSIPIVYFWGRDGIPAYMVLTAAVAALISWSYARRVQTQPIKVPLRQVATEAGSLFRLGLAFVSSGLMATGALFLLRIFVMRETGVVGAGQFQAANAISMIYVGFILQAMGTDFYPRLTSAADDNHRCNKLVNEQAEISILLALPGVLATLALAPWVIHFFYSNKFELAGEILCWQVAGMMLRVLSWPMGFIVVAKGRAAILFLTDLIAYSVYVALGWVGLKFFGLPGTGMAFLSLYIFHWCMIYVVVRRMSGFSWSSTNVRLSLLGVITIATTLCVRLRLQEPWATITGCALALIVGIYCLRALVLLVGIEELNKYTCKIGVSFPLRKAPEVHQAAIVTSRK
jgi:antigen flippase